MRLSSPQVASNHHDAMQEPTGGALGHHRCRDETPQASRRDTPSVWTGSHGDSLSQAQFSFTFKPDTWAVIVFLYLFLDVALIFSKCLFLFQIFSIKTLSCKIGSNISSRYIFLEDTSVLCSLQNGNDEMRPKTTQVPKKRNNDAP